MPPFAVSVVHRKHVWIAGALLIALLGLSMFALAPHARTLLVQGDNDDIMRWMSVKAWLAGQSWFDMTQYRVEPPWGLSMHWSRYLDAALAGLYSLLALGLSPEAAERWTFALWPNLLLLALLGLVAKGTGRLLGAGAALFAMALVMTWMPIRGITFATGRIDHHNVQILLTTIMAMAMILPGRAWLMGAAAGLAAALSLAIGLETLVFVAAGGLVLVARAAVEAEGARGQLIGFCNALPVGALVFFAGQTAPQDWLVPHCDALATPILAILVIASTSSLAPLALYSRVSSPVARLAAVAGLALFGVWMFVPLLTPCLAGPYGMLPPEAQDFITSRISEALPALAFATLRPLTFANVLLPILVITALSSLFWLRNRGSYDKAQRAAVGQMLIFGWLGLIGSLVQVRMNIIAAPALPFLAGHVGAELLRRWTTRRSLAAFLTAAVVGLAAFGTQYLNRPAMTLASRLAGTDLSQRFEQPSFDHGCRTEKALAELNTLTKARLLTTLNLGAPLLLVTHHDALSVPYQRGAHTFWNGSFPFRSEALMLQAIRQSAPDYVVICREATYDAEHGFARALNEGRLPGWLIPADIGSTRWLVLALRPEAMPPSP